MKGITVTLPIDRSVPPVIQPLRRCPIPLLDKVKSKIDELLEMDIIERVTRPTSWVSPLVPILKENGELRLCIDMRRANQAIQRLNHPLPVFEDFLPKFRNAKLFTTLDIRQAFHQVELSHDCRDITTFVTNWGLFRYTRLLFGVNAAPELFQNLMESILADCVNVAVFIDDIVIFGATEGEHDAAVKGVLLVLKRYGILLNDHKCKFKQHEIRFLGHKLSSNGVSPADEKVKSILQFRPPKTKEELRSFLGLVTLGSHVADQWTDETEVYIRRIVAVSLSTFADCDDCCTFDVETEIFIRTIQESAAIDIEEVIQATMSDNEMRKLKECVQSGKWDNAEMKQYALFRTEYTVANNLIMRGNKLVIPAGLRHRMCQLAHEGHPGESKMKTRLRDRCWWPGIDTDAVQTCKSCEGCRLVQVPDAPEPMSRRSLPEKAWVDVALDFLGPMPGGEYVLVVIDYYSRYTELAVMNKITARETINQLKRMFRVWGPPRTITLDNAKQFVSTELHEYCQLNGIHLNHTTPYWPQANGEVERQNRSLLKRMKIANALYGEWKNELDRYLEMYNNTPHSVTGKSPNELLQNRRLRSKMPHVDDLATTPPSTEFRDKDHEKRSWEKREDAKRMAKPSNIEIGDNVLMKNLLPANKLSTNFLKEKFMVIGRNGSNVTIESVDSGRTYDRNTSHLKKVVDAPSNTGSEPELIVEDGEVLQRADAEIIDDRADPDQNEPLPEEGLSRRSSRTRQIPQRYR
ncbi:uncharacterized protein K02A2.6-like [Culex quinquefasciatus]|uniref:uncharacterized protein K02A2.6-like n=1 Tax=Culex quinquefasciatus TaxID=7176 RepID=UPI0018E31416|nr:uncharacterized protein K02A2.6-like [Culex quinquefasciatus]